MAEITNAVIRKIIDSRGNPTAEVDIISNRAVGRASAPSGASKGTFEVKDYPGGGIDQGIRAFERVAHMAVGMRLSDQKNFDAMLHEADGTNDFARIGGNVAVAMSLAYAKASALSENMELYQALSTGKAKSLPIPIGNIIGGGRHAINGTTMQEFLSLARAGSYSESAFANVSVHKNAGKLLRGKFPQLSLGLGDEKAWVAPLSDDEALEILSDAIKAASDETKADIGLSVDLAASEFCDNGTYSYGDRILSTDEQIDFVADLAQRFGIRSLEDPLDESDFDGFARLTKKIGSKTMIIGDDLFVTNKERLQKGIGMGAANAILIKPNQIGTLSDMIDTVELAKRSNYKTVISHRSGETEDSTIAHLAVGLGIGYIKTGTIGGERTAKHNELIRIEERMRNG
ncbi:MAG: enolase [Candidatus Marsarchaeota archaeon]|nr:enolase [Candidatus Marsarchaeota archaeon]